MTRTELLRTANRHVVGDRDETYGSPEESFGLIAELWSAYLDLQITPVTVAALMSLFKIARMRGKPHIDNFIDLAGYAACGGELLGEAE
nr:MAG TPA: hypothetical protein [Caudoviricetes sp.]